ncbi:uncharacterized protein GIQ15_05990 [Arthroderma uncinatum]|uniref:uncharacterized protein n=1 Tax=Arthroderma uncinatum TaxID=74035 RepID=UPI00144AB98D|nr:uncharacterized protein GIQ15_05990 [Arthroderma uncinatum]KAF3480643.1 hypothetical protein GIQ15_05990 [Arthroderma uncinatum]
MQPTKAKHGLMMDLLRSWIEPLVEGAVRQSIDPDDQVAGSKELGKTVDDGSNFRIPVKRPKLVQLVKWLSSEPTPHAVLSDASTTIRAIFSERARINYKEQYDTDIRKNSTGSVLRISKVQITIGKLRTPPPEIHLYIEEIKIEGCEGTGLIGNPVDIARCKAIVELGDKWAREDGDAGPQALDRTNDTSDDSDTESILSGPGSNSIHDDEDPEPSDDEDTNSTQEGGWHTQAPTSAVARMPKVKNAEDHAPPKSKMQDLLNTLRPKGSNSGRKSPNPSTQGEIPALHGHKPVVPQPVYDLPIPDPNIIESAGTEPRRSSPLSSKIYSQHRQSPPASPSSISPNIQAHSHKPDQPSKSSVLIPSREVKVIDKGFFSGWNRIRRRDVFISEAQQSLIESTDSWIPPNTGMRMPQGHVPVSLIQQWSEKRREKAAIARISPSSESEALDNDAEPPLSSTHSQLGDYPLGTKQWPPSPVAARVPPDSSPLNNEGGSPLRFHRDTPGSDSLNLVDNSTSLETTNLPNSAAQTGALPDTESYEDSDIELSIPRGLYTSTQDHDVDPTSSMIENETEGTINRSSIPMRITETMLSQQSQESHSPSQQPITPSPPDQHIGSSETPSPNATTILVPATLKFSARKSQDRPPSHDPTIESPAHDSTIHNSSSSGYDRMAVEAQLAAGLNSTELSDSKNPPGVLQVPGSSLEVADQAMVVLPSIETSVPPMPPQEIDRKRKRTDESPSRSSSPRKVSRMSEADTSTTSHQSKKTFGQVSFSSQTEEIYYKFLQAYKTYSGSLDTFRRACCELQSLRDKGLMQKSMLWDDFVAREVTEYQHYISRCLERHKTPDAYQPYFQKHAKFAQYKRRNLTVKNLQTIVVEAEGEYDSDGSGEGEGGTQLAMTPEPPTASPRVIQESPYKRPVRDLESEVSDSDTDAVSPEAPHMYDRASVELGDDAGCIAPSNLKRRQAMSFVEEEEEPDDDDDEDEEEDISHAGHGRLPQPTSSPNNRPYLGHPIELGTGRILASNPSSKAPIMHPSPLPHGLNPPQTRGQQQTRPSKSKSPPVRKSPVPSLPPHKKVSGVNGDKTSYATTSAWWKNPNTLLKKFSREYACIPCERISPTQHLNPPEVPVDEAGVVIVDSQKRQQKGGRMDSMGLKF